MDERRAPGWLRVVNPLNRLLLARGIGPAPQHLLSVVGRRSGRLRTTPVAVVVVDGERYAVAGFDGSDWVKNARAAGRGSLRRGRRVEPVALTEVPVGERAPILQAFAERVRGGRSFLTIERVDTTAAAAATPEVFARAAGRHPVFRLSAA